MKEQLTGRQRFRIWKGKLVLQVERRRLVTRRIAGTIDSNYQLDWRDAKLEDLDLKLTFPLRNTKRIITPPR